MSGGILDTCSWLKCRGCRPRTCRAAPWATVARDRLPRGGRGCGRTSSAACRPSGRGWPGHCRAWALRTTAMTEVPDLNTHCKKGALRLLLVAGAWRRLACRTASPSGTRRGSRSGSSNRGGSSFAESSPMSEMENRSSRLQLYHPDQRQCRRRRCGSPPHYGASGRISSIQYSRTRLDMRGASWSFSSGWY